MKKNYIFLLLLVLTVSFSNVAVSQTSLGTCSGFISNLKKELTVPAGRKENKNVLLQIEDLKSFNGEINFKESGVSSELLIGEIKNISGSSFYLKVSEQSLEGHIILRKTKEAYKYSSDAKGNAYVSKVDINSMICLGYPIISETEVKTTKVSSAAINPDLLKLESFPGGLGCVLLDFDGYYMPAGNGWNNGNAINAAPSGMNDAKILQCFELVAEDYRPFNLNITTNEDVFNSYPKTKRKRIVITPTTTADPVGGSGGIAIIGAFASNTDIPAWCFNITTGKSAGETVSHEIGHLFSLKHDGRSSPKEDYFSGLFETSWGPVMGATFLRPVSQWSKGEYNGANNTEDDVAIISNATNGIGYRVDDYGNDTASAFNLTLSGTGEITQRTGVIEKENDKDFFAFTTTGGNINIEVNTKIGIGNSHLLIKLYNSEGVEMGQYWDPDPFILSASMNVDLTAGKYFIGISGTGAGNATDGGYSAYGSIGSYSISGTVPNDNLDTVSFDKNLSLVIYPNPSNKIITIKSDHDAALNLINALGVTIKTFKVTANGEDILNVENLSSGVYFLSEMSKGKFITHKFVRK